MGRKYRILVVEDEPLIAEDISGYLIESGFEVAGIAETGEEALRLAEKTGPDAMLLDINLGEGMDGVEVAGIIRDRYQIPVVFLTSHADKGTLERAKHTLPAGYLLKPFEGNDLMTSLEIAIFNHMRKNGNEISQPSIESLNHILPVALSQREYDLLLELQSGKTNKEIGKALFISINTVKTHLQRLFDKLDVHNRTQAIFRIRELSK